MPPLAPPGFLRGGSNNFFGTAFFLERAHFSLSKTRQTVNLTFSLLFLRFLSNLHPFTLPHIGPRGGQSLRLRDFVPPLAPPGLRTGGARAPPGTSDATPLLANRLGPLADRFGPLTPRSFNRDIEASGLACTREFPYPIWRHNLTYILKLASSKLGHVPSPYLTFLITASKDK